jgi:hypothetical protein
LLFGIKTLAVEEKIKNPLPIHCDYFDFTCKIVILVITFPVFDRQLRRGCRVLQKENMGALTTTPA